MNKEKLAKIFSIYKELNREEQIVITLDLIQSQGSKFQISKKIKLTISPDDFVISGPFNGLNREILTKLLEEAKTYVDKEYENLKILLNNLKNKL